MVGVRFGLPGERPPREPGREAKGPAWLPPSRHRSVATLLPPPGRASAQPAALLALLALLVTHGPARAQTFREDVCVPNGQVAAAAAVGNTLYFGGTFNAVG